ncbi:MAG: PAS domain-containing sensor histidine kinase, partial [Oscillospiraceae bacterium]|nr:PAS domain-containing sensor histidine kinase [Oscillospiraceae bacterium]
MTKRIFRSVFAALCCMLLACFLVITGILYSHFTNLQKLELAEQTQLASEGVERSGLDYLEALGNFENRLTWVAADGGVLYDSEAEAAQMENHLEREEIAEALQNGFGESERASETLTERTLYRAQLLSDGSVLRLSATESSVLALLIGMLEPLAVVLVLAAALSALLARSMAKRIVEPLNKIDLESPLENEAYDELAPLLGRIESQQRRISRQRLEL